MQRVICSKARRLKLSRPFDFSVPYDDRTVGARGQQLHAVPAFWIGCASDLDFGYFAADPLPETGFTLRKDDQNCLCLETYPCLPLIVKWPVQTAHIKVHSLHWPLSPFPIADRLVQFPLYPDQFTCTSAL